MTVVSTPETCQTCGLEESWSESERRQKSPTHPHDLKKLLGKRDCENQQVCSHPSPFEIVLHPAYIVRQIRPSSSGLHRLHEAKRDSFVFNMEILHPVQTLSEEERRLPVTVRCCVR